MIPIGAGQPPATNSPYTPVGKTPVGLEPSENKRATLPPVEESAALSKQRADETTRKPAGPDAKAETDARGQNSAVSATDLDAAEVAQVRELAATARKVQAHEAAHAAVGGALAGAKSFSYVTGPDGVRYAVAGEVSIEFGQSDDPELTVRNASQVRAAALAPADPSSQDLHVAAQASQIVQQAQQDLSKLRSASATGNASRNRITSALDAFGQVQRDEPDNTSRFDQRA